MNLNKSESGAEKRSPRPLAVLFAASGALAAVEAAVNVLWMVLTVEQGQIREMRILWILRQLYEARDINLLILLPDIANRPFALADPFSLLLFFCLAVFTHLLVSWTAALLLTPLVLALARRFPAAEDRPKTVEFWSRVYPVAALVGFSLPAFHHFNDIAYTNIWFGAAIIIAILVYGAWGYPGSLRLLLRLCTGVTIAAVVLALLGGAFALISRPGAGTALQPPATPGRPNILLVSIDSLRGDHLHCYGYPRETSPYIDALAEEGVRFETAVAPTSWTLPTHVTLLTALPPEMHGVIHIHTRLGDDAVTLAEVLWQQGYSTAGFVSGSYLAASYGFSQGFDHYDDYNIVKSSNLLSHRGATSPGLYRVVEKWLGRWDQAGRARPFFVFLHMWDVHYDYTPPPPYDTMFDPDYEGMVTAENFLLGFQVHPDMDPRDLEHIIALYDGEIRFTDLYLGRVFDLLKQLGVYDDTIIVVTSDHGDEFFEHGNKGHNKTLYDESLLVPLVFRFPKEVPRGKVVREQVRIKDVALTILSLAEIKAPAEFGSSLPRGTYAERDLSPALTRQATGGPPPPAAFGDLNGIMASLRTESYKLIRDLRNPAKAELYDLASDPGEQSNLLRRGSPPPAEGAALAKELDDWRQECKKSDKFSSQFVLSEDQIEHLRSLGYIK